MNEYIKKMVNFGKFVTVEGVMASLSNKGDNKSFLEFIRRYIIRPPEKLEPNTLKKYATTLSHLRKFRTHIYFGEIDNKFLRDFTHFMQFDLELGGGATKKYLKSLKKVTRQARVEDFISPQQMEFLYDGLKIRVQKPKRTFLDLRR